MHDYLLRYGGAERVLFEMASIFKDAPIYTLLYNKKKMKKWFRPERVRVSFLQKIPKVFKNQHRYFLPFLPIAIETLDLREFDLVISSSSAFAKGVVTRTNTFHICYCHNPSRFLWDSQDEYLRKNRVTGLKKMIARIFFHCLRLWDKSSSLRVDEFLANSKSTAARIWKYYRAKAKVIYPPMSLPHFISFSEEASREAAKNYFLIVSQLSAYKNIDVAVEAFNKLELPLVIIGEGPERNYLQKIAKDNIKILGWRSDKILARYYQNCFALVFPAEEDFGLAPVEAMNFGKPVLALRRGGATETVIEGVTGEFFDDSLPEILADGVRRLKDNYKNYSPLLIKKYAEKFNRQRFRRELLDFVKKSCYDKK